MADRVTFSGLNLTLPEIAAHYIDVEASLRAYYKPSSPTYNGRFNFNTKQEVEEKLEARLSEQRQLTMLTILSSVEAAFLVDYYRRCEGEKKDPLSKDLRKIYKFYSQKRTRPSLVDEIFPVWEKYTVSFRFLKGAFKLRHWLAHGRYWVPKFGQEYNYEDVYSLAESAFLLLEI